MIIRTFLKIKLIALVLFINNSISSQTQKALISIENRDFVANAQNYFRVVAQQLKPVSIGQMSATFKPYNGEVTPIEIIKGDGYFAIYPDSIGIIEISIKLRDTTEVKRFRVVPITAVGRLSSHGANEDLKIGAGEFMAQRGITASIECCGFDAKCTVLGFQAIRISATNKVERGINKGGHFDDNVRKIIDHTQPGDLFIFRNILYRCPSAKEPQRLEDMTFEIE